MSGDFRVRLLVHEAGDGRREMAIDETLLDRVSRGESDPVIRLYGFSPPTLSVGRFQHALQEIDIARVEADGLTFVRRPTGGRAVLHAGELTYAAAIGRTHLPGFSKREVYRFIVPFLLGGLRRLGLADAVSSAGRGNPLNPDCFASTGEYEIDSASGRKLIGSAQMITRGGVLQHGSIPLTDTGRNLNPYLIGHDLIGNDLIGHEAESGHESSTGEPRGGPGGRVRRGPVGIRRCRPGAFPLQRGRPGPGGIGRGRAAFP